MDNASLPEQPSQKSVEKKQGDKQSNEASQPKAPQEVPHLEGHRQPSAQGVSQSEGAKQKNSKLDKTVAPQPTVAPKPIKAPILFTGEIPVAVRESVETPSRFPPKRIMLLLGLLGVGAIALLLGGWVALQLRQAQSQVTNPTTSPTTGTPMPQSTATTAPDGTLLGHYPYNVAPLSELQAIVPDGSIKLRKAAANAYMTMSAAARADGVNLTPISGFRTLEDQQSLFFDVKAERGQVATKRAEVSAPPGYSEHHTGYAIDVGDGSVPATNLSQTFEKTAAFKWLQANAAHYNFEISFTKGNKQGVSYEPWHWRFVGDRDSLETFYKARGK